MIEKEIHFTKDSNPADGSRPIRGYLLALAALVLVGFAAVYYSYENLVPRSLYYSEGTVGVADKYEVRVEKADTNIKRIKGLSGREGLGDNEGLYFTFEDAKDSLYPVFWMKGMSFAIDIIWIDKGQIVFIDRNVQPASPETPDEQLKLYSPTVPVDAVLEVPAGWTQDKEVQVGDSVKLK